jgi:hypothetical protein
VNENVSAVAGPAPPAHTIAATSTVKERRSRETLVNLMLDPGSLVWPIGFDRPDTADLSWRPPIGLALADRKLRLGTIPNRDNKEMTRFCRDTMKSSIPDLFEPITSSPAAVLHPAPTATRGRGAHLKRSDRRFAILNGWLAGAQIRRWFAWSDSAVCSASGGMPHAAPALG